MADSVLVWGNNDSGQATMPVAAQSGVTAIAAGSHHTVALKGDGSVVAWGLNDHGQTTIPLAAQSGATAIAAGGNHTVALKSDGSVVAWGSNQFGQTTIPDAARSGVTAIAAGGSHTLVLKDDGSAVAWGSNEFGQAAIPDAARGGVTAIAAGTYHNVALKSDGSVVAWGYNDLGQRTIPLAARSGVTAIAAGRSHTVALKSDGSVVAWGWDGFGLRTIPLAAKSGVTAIAAGRYHTVALKDNGTVVAWGDDAAGQTTVPLAARSGVSAIAAGGDHTVALVIATAPGIATQPVGQDVYLWQQANLTVVATGYPLNYQWRKDGEDLAGATGDTFTLPFSHTDQTGSYTVVVTNPRGSVTSAPPAVLKVNPIIAGTVVTWGYDVRAPVPIAAQSGVTAIAAGGFCAFRACGDHTVALKSDGSVVDWGSNDSDRIDVSNTARRGVTAIAAGAEHIVALKDDGTVVAWGRNGYRQVTGPSPTEIPEYAIASPVMLEGRVLSAVTGVAAGWEHTVALKRDGTLVTWGGASSVPLGAETGVTAIAASVYRTVALKNDGSVVDETTTVPVAARSGVKAIAAGFHHTLALKEDGSVVAWGWNGSGQVTGTPTDTHDSIANPVILDGQVLGGVTAIAAGLGYSVALKHDGTMVAWGDDSYGQVTGTPTTGTRHAIASPVTLGGHVLSGVTAIAAGPHYTVALIGGVPLLPSLKARPNGKELILSWPTNAPGFGLQSTLDLTPPVTWLDSTNLPAVIGAHFTLTNSTSGATRFYRLRDL